MGEHPAACVRPAQGAAELLHGLEGEPYPLTPLVVALMGRAGESERAAQHLERVGRAALDPGPVESSLSVYLDSHAAEVALRIGDGELARRCYERLVPYAGRAAQAGSALNAGPVDTFLALGAAARGDPGRAAEHADAALALTDRRKLSLCRAWVEGLREEFGF